MKRLTGAFLQGLRTASKVEGVRSVVRSGSRRMEPLFVRSFSTGSASRFERAEATFRSKYFRLLSFTSGLGLSLGGISYAGLMGFGSSSSNSKDISKLKSELEAIRKKYPTILTSPVFSEHFGHV